jgi:hypothetical protein
MWTLRRFTLCNIVICCLTKRHSLQKHVHLACVVYAVPPVGYMRCTHANSTTCTSCFFTAYCMKLSVVHIICILSNVRMCNEWWIGKDMEGADCRLFHCTIPVFAWKEWGNPRKTDVGVVNAPVYFLNGLPHPLTPPAFRLFQRFASVPVK